MGCVSSRMAPSRTVVEPRVTRSEFYAGHPGLHATPAVRLESEVSSVVRAQDPNDDIVIKVQKVNLNVAENTRAHNTNEYDITTDKNSLVIRRGQTFDVDIEFNREYNRGKDDMRLVFRFGKTPKSSKGTHVELVLSDKDEPGEWGATIKSKGDNSVKVSVVSPPDCFIGKWKMEVHVIKRADKVTVYRHEPSDMFYMLFNPWCKDDLVFMQDPEKLKEYVLNESGRIYRGSSRRISHKPWAFGQFEDDILDCAMYLLDEMSGISDNNRGNPVIIARRLSAMVNSPDDGGVLVGNWSGKYEGGSSPLDWNGSIAILEEFYKTKRPVRYGQCWVFSGVLTTLCRTLGMAARSVTNFVSAHDTDGSITIDAHFGEDKKPLKQWDTDSVWNFHVWNDVWMARPDLPSGYGGWQAIDATPQETSEGLYCMGPTSLHAVKNGNVDFAYDGQFVFGEVNADRLLWMVKDSGSVDLVRKQKYSVGKYMSTKAVGGDQREDVTGEYKYSEGSEEERAAVRRAHKHSTRTGVYETGPEDVDFELDTNPDTFMGETLVIKLKLRNKSSEERKADGRIVISTMYYTGVHSQDIYDKEVDTVTLQPNGEHVVAVEISQQEYLNCLVDHCILKVSPVFLVQQTNQTYCEIEELRLRKPHLTVKAPDRGKVKQTVNVEVSFKNPLSVALTSCELRIDGPGLIKPLIQKYGNVEAGQEFTATVPLIPRKPGKREILVNFNAHQIRAVDGSREILIE